MIFPRALVSDTVGISSKILTTVFIVACVFASEINSNAAVMPIDIPKLKEAYSYSMADCLDTFTTITFIVRVITTMIYRFSARRLETLRYNNIHY